MAAAKRILFSPLDWGLGHATRCVPLIRRELALGHEVVLAASGRSAKLLQKTFPQLELHEIPGYDVHYSRNNLFILNLLTQIPKLFRAVRKERKWLNELLEKRSFDLVVSDNRYGMFSAKTRCVIITHQVFPITPKPLKRLTHSLVMRYLRKFDEVWIPDYAGDQNLAGLLCHGSMPFQPRFIGPLSRFESEINTDLHTTDSPEILALISGPEPQRTILQEILTEQLLSTGKTCWIVSGVPEKEVEFQEGKLRIFPHLQDRELSAAILKARTIICRSGYSTLMDLHALGKKAILIPTPGQSEQEYLAAHFRERFGWTFLAQDELTTRLPSFLKESN